MKTFWIVCKSEHPQVMLRATKRHETRESAVEEALRLTKQGDGGSYMVFEMIGVACPVSPPAEWRDAEKE